MRRLLIVAVAAALLGGCATQGRRGMMAERRYTGLDCAAIDAERARLESQTAALYARTQAHGLLARPDAAAWPAGWPTALFVREKGARDRQRFEQLSISYEQLRYAARAKRCPATFATDVSRAPAVQGIPAA